MLKAIVAVALLVPSLASASQYRNSSRVQTSEQIRLWRETIEGTRPGYAHPYQANPTKIVIRRNANGTVEGFRMTQKRSFFP
jgi:hypothetical protein